ncbi:hypothetical protein RJ639_031806, partial [Escallonia herrerae]
CDLVVFAGNASEKLASGLLEPFLSHLKSAKDQISKGGYSITLQPAVNAPWFTKATLERFVRFVNTPEVLERFVTIEKEIAQIESSVQTVGQTAGATETERNVLAADENTKRSAASSKTRKAILGKEQAMAYARALVAGFEMDYIDDLISFADAFGASRLREACINFMELCNKKNDDGIWMDEVAAMQACSGSELSYLRASGVILAGEETINASASDSTVSHGSFDINQDNSLPASTQTQSIDGKGQVPMGWAGHFPQYMQNFQGSMFQQMPPFQTPLYYAGRQAPPFYAGNMLWPPNVNDSTPTHGKESQTANDHGDSSYESDTDQHVVQGVRNSSIEKIRNKKNKKSSSRKVVIRNINYVTSTKDGQRSSASGDDSCDEDEFFDGDSLKQQVEEVVGSLVRRNKSTSRGDRKRDGRSHKNILDGSHTSADEDLENVLASNTGEKKSENWDVFQNLIMRDADSRFSGINMNSLQHQDYSETSKSGKRKSFVFDANSEAMTKLRDVSTNSFAMIERDTTTEGKTNIRDFESGEIVRPVNKRESGYEVVLFSKGTEESGNYSRGALPNRGTESSITKSQKEGDWFITSHPDKLANENGSIDHDSFDINYDRPILGDPQLGPDIFMVPEIVGATRLSHSAVDNLQEKVADASAYEPEDLYMVLGRDSAAEQAVATWDPEMDYGNNSQVIEAVKKHSGDEPAHYLDANSKESYRKINGPTQGKLSSKEARSKKSVGSPGNSKSEIVSRSKKPSESRVIMQKNKSEKEEEKRKKMEELRIQRQKRIAERSAASGCTPATSKKTQKESKTAMDLNLMKNGKPKARVPTQESMKLDKPILRSSTIDRLAAARVTKKLSPTEVKPSQPRKSTSKENGIARTSLSQKTVGAESKKLGLNKVSPSPREHSLKNSNGLPRSVSDAGEKKDPADAIAALPLQVNTSQATHASDGINNSEGIELHSVSLGVKNGDGITQRDTLTDNSCNALSCDRPLSVFTENHTAQLGGLEGNNKVISKASPGFHKDATFIGDFGGLVPDMAEHSLPTSQSKALNYSTLNVGEAGGSGVNEKHSFSPEIAVIELSTPPPDIEMSPEPNHTRKKWVTDENSPKAIKGFRKLLLFGRKS